MGYGPFLSILNQKPRCHNKKHNVAILYKHQQDIDIFPRGQTSNISIISIDKRSCSHCIHMGHEKAQCRTYFPSLLVILLKHLTKVARWKKIERLFNKIDRHVWFVLTRVRPSRPNVFGPSTCQHILEQIARRAIF